MQHARAATVDAEVPRTFGPYTRGRELGQGASGRVFTCTRLGIGGAEQFAAKAIDLRRLRLSAKADRELKKLQREIDILRRVPPHENLVRSIDSLEEGTWCFLILEFISAGDLFSTLIRRGSRPSFSEAETVFVLRQLVEGLDFLHSHGVIHRDLKLENILVVSEARDGDGGVMCTVKITDFGLSKVVGNGLSVAQSTVGSPKYISPEVLATGEHDFRADLWSLGVLLYVLLAGRFPFEGQPSQQQVLDSTVDKLSVSDDAKAVVRGLMQLDRTKRLTLNELREHPLLSADHSSCDSGGPTKKRRSQPEVGEVDITESSLFGSEDQPALLVSEESVKVDPPPAVEANGEGAAPHFSPVFLISQESIRSDQEEDVLAWAERAGQGAVLTAPSVGAAGVDAVPIVFVGD